MARAGHPGSRTPPTSSSTSLRGRLRPTCCGRAPAIPSKITEEHVDRWYEMWMREGNRGAILDRLRVYGSADVVEVVGQVKVPVLILWGEANPQTPIEQAAELKGMLKNAAKSASSPIPASGTRRSRRPATSSRATSGPISTAPCLPQLTP